MKILLPLDHSHFSQQALKALVEQPHKRGTEVRLLHVIEPITSYLTAGLIPEVTFDSTALEADRRKQGHLLLSRAARKLRKAGFKTGEVIEFGDPKSTILDYSDRWKPNLIVLGSHGLRGLSHFLLGSVSEAVMRHAHCSVTVVRAPRSAKSSAKMPR